MITTTLSSREFNQDTGLAKKAALKGVVFITDRGRPSHVLMSAARYQSLLQGNTSIVDLLGMPGAEDIDFDPPKLKGEFARPADFS